MPYAGMIPMPTIAAILFIVAYNMCQWRTFRDLVKTAPKSDILVLIVTFVLTVIFDLVVAIEIGMVLACLLFIKRMSEETHADSWVYTDDDTPDNICRNYRCRSVFMKLPDHCFLEPLMPSNISLSKTLPAVWFSV